MANVQKFTNSPLVSHTNISPNRTLNRTHIIDTITIHCVVGQCSVEALGKLFKASSTKASSNYGIGYDGRIGMYVEEKDRSWCSSNASNDNRAITIEVASDTKHPYAVKDAAYESLIKLVADICKRNNIKELKWKADKSLVGKVDKQNMTVHRWFANKACPGDYLYSRHGDIAKKVNKLLGVSSNTNTNTNNNSNTSNTSNTSNKSDFNLGDAVKLVSGATYYNGKSMPSWLFNMTLYVRGISGNNITISTQKTGAITGIVNKKYLKNISNNQSSSAPKTETKPKTENKKEDTKTPTTFKVGDEVKLVSGAKYTSGSNVASFLFAKKLYVRGVSGDNITISWLKTGAVSGVVNKKYLTKY